jgi:hypothetical protein
MSRALALPARQVTALCRGAAKAGYVPEVKIGDVVIRLVPAETERPIDNDAGPEAFETLDEYRAWRQRGRDRGD